MSNDKTIEQLEEERLNLQEEILGYYDNDEDIPQNLIDLIGNINEQINDIYYQINEINNRQCILNKEIEALEKLEPEQVQLLMAMLMKLIKVSPEFTDIEKDGIDLILHNFSEAQELKLELNNIDTIRDNIDASEWETDVDYILGQFVKYEGNIYKVTMNHHSQENWTPNYAHALFTLIATEKDIEDINEGKCPEFVQPMANTTYSIGDCVTFEGDRYESLINGNAWSPNDYPQGWQKL